MAPHVGKGQHLTRDIETIDIVLTLMKLNLKQKKYPFSTFCIENLEDSKKTYDFVLKIWKIAKRLMIKF
jgi:hypothetical protein